MGIGGAFTGVTKGCFIAALATLASGSAWGATVINCALTSPTPGNSPAPCVDFSNVSGPGYNNSFSWLTLTGSIMVSSTNPFDPPADGTMTGGVDITVLPPAESELSVMGNTKYVYLAGQWVPGVILNDATFPGHFGFSASGNPSNGYSGDTILAAPDPQAPVTIDFTQGVGAVAFQISSLSDPTFIATLTAYGQAGNLLGTYILNTDSLNIASSILNGGTEGDAVGGPCIFLSNISKGTNGYTNLSPGHGCTNTPAPFVGLSEQSLQLIGINQIYSIQISTNDPRGFAIDTLYAEEDPPISTPEPAAPCLALFGLGLLYFRSRHFRWSR